MRQLYITFILFLFISTKAFATPQLTSFSIWPDYLQNGRIKVYNNGSTPFVAMISATRAINGTSWENVTMELVFYAQIGNAEHVLKTITLTSSDFDGEFLKFYNEHPQRVTAANNKVNVSIPQNVERSDIRVKYRYKDANNNWIPNTTYGYYTFNSFYQTINVGVPYPSPITINSVNKLEAILIGTPCGFNHPDHMENGVWKGTFQIEYTKNDTSIQNSDIYWEWVNVEGSLILSGQKQFLIYPFGSTVGTALDGERKVSVEANDYLDEYQAKIIVRAKSRSTGTVYSNDYTFYFTAVNH